jgi:hypothetical protein
VNKLTTKAKGSRFLRRVSTAANKNQLNHFVADALLPRVQELKDAASSGTDGDKLRGLFEKKVGAGLNYFFDIWRPIYAEEHGDVAARRAIKTAQQLRQDVAKVPFNELAGSIVKAVWYLLSLSLEDMDEVPVFADQLTFTNLDTAIRDATRRIS